MADNKNKLKRICLGSFNVLKQPLTAVVFGLLFGAVMIIISKENPLTVYIQMFEKSFFKPYYLMQTLTRSTPIIACSIAIAAAWRAGYINIGVEGQMIVGSFVATACSLYIPGPPILIMVISIIAGMAAGAIYALIAAVLNLKYNTPLVLCTLMMNYIANYIASYFVTYPMKDTSGDGLAIQTPLIGEGMRFAKLNPNTTFNIGFIVAIVVVILFMYLSNKTTFGYESKMTGMNPRFAKYGGVKDKQIMLNTMALSGAIAAIAGICEIYGVKYRYMDGMFTSTGYAWTGLMAALLAGLHPVGMLFSSIFLSGLQVGGQAIQRTTSIPLQMATVIQASITLFVSAKLTLNFIKKGKNLKGRMKKKDKEAASNGI